MTADDYRAAAHRPVGFGPAGAGGSSGGTNHEDRPRTDRSRELWEGARVDRVDWLERAACRESDLSQFFVRGSAQARPAQKLCAGCEVQDACLDYALEHDIEFGVWGGMTERQRRALRRRQRAA
jgi:WhiB family redox-sensing transcriptional regulator